MNKSLIAITTLAFSLFIGNAQASFFQPSRSQTPQGVADTNNKEQDRLRECITKCTPSECKSDVKKAKECAQLCQGHNISVANMLYKKCSMSASSIQENAHVSENTEQLWDPLADADMSKVNSGGPKKEALAENTQPSKKPQSSEKPAAVAQNTESSAPTQEWEKPQAWAQPSENSAQAQTWENPKDVKKSQAWEKTTKEPTWKGTKEPTLAERTRDEQLSTEHPYGVADADMQHYGIDKYGTPLNQSSSTSNWSTSSWSSDKLG